MILIWSYVVPGTHSRTSIALLDLLNLAERLLDDVDNSSIL